MLERLAKSKVDFHVENYGTTRAAADRLLRTVGAVPDEPPKQIEAAPLPTAFSSGVGSYPYARPHDSLRETALSERTQALPTYDRTKRTADVP